ncbi:hypothetical protein C2G38_2222502 [Gigaspora rosea]|uniref:SHSP domain-containing protein n=1 Tax=Gigaspora rosea TaxID=44941 RepID=A0A397U5R6_9GLOM|nr:hypothetical protein C2G38_2222502 [Gigaspora rosea]
MSIFHDFITTDPNYNPIYDPIYDQSFDLNYPIPPRTIGLLLIIGLLILLTDGLIDGEIEVLKEEISIDHHDHELVIQGESKRAATFETATSRVRERDLGRFRKHVYLLRELSEEKTDIEAKYENRLLEIKIPRRKQG